MGVIYTKKGDYSVILKMENPVRKYSADIDSYYDFTSLMSSIMQSLGEGYAIHKQDVFVKREFDMKAIAKNKKVEPTIFSPLHTSSSSTAVNTRIQRPT